MKIIDINTSSKIDLKSLVGISSYLADAIIMGRPFSCRKELLKIKGISEYLIESLELQGLWIDSKPLDKERGIPISQGYPSLAPRPILRFLDDEKPTLIVNEPASDVTIRFDLTDPRMPIDLLYFNDKSAIFDGRRVEPRFKMIIESGSLDVDENGILIKKGSVKENYSWDGPKMIASALVRLAQNDGMFRRAGVNLGRSLKKAASSIRNLKSTVSDGTPENLPYDLNEIHRGDPLPSTIAQKFLFLSNPHDENSIPEGSFINELLQLGTPLVDCTKTNVAADIETRLETALTSLNQAILKKDRCLENCDEEFFELMEADGIKARAVSLAGKFKSYNRDFQRKCINRCENAIITELNLCIGTAIITSIIEVTETVEHCITKSGYVLPEEEKIDGDLVLFESDSSYGDFIDTATGGFGYSQIALICGDKMIHKLGDELIASALDYYGDRKNVTVRLGLSDKQRKDLCKYIQNIKLNDIFVDFDAIEETTFYTNNDPGRNIFTLLIMNYLDKICFNRKNLGLKGFTSPNDIALNLGAPSAKFDIHP